MPEELPRHMMSQTVKVMAEMKLVFVTVRLFCLLLLLECRIVAPACSLDEPPIVVEPDGCLEDTLRSLDPLRNCTARLYLLPGIHVIASSVSVSAASVVLSSHPNYTDRPVVRCGDNMSHPGDSVNETEEVGFLTFWKGAQDVSIAGVDFEGCPRTVQFIEVDSVNISDCAFRNFTQGPINMYNSPVVTVSASIFENNHAQSVFTDFPSRISGGGLSVTIYYVSTNNSAGTFNYTIQNCTFFNNSAISTVATVDSSTILHGSHINGRGGGVAFYIVHPPRAIIKVLSCNFTCNSASDSGFGGGLYILSPRLITEEDFTVVGNHFEGNVAGSGGGITLGSAVKTERRKVDLTLMESVKFNGNLFVRNKADVGGAMFIIPGLPPASVLLIGTYEISNNMFQENVANSLGAAVALALRVAFTVLRSQTVTVFKNNTFDANNCTMGGIINSFYYPVHFQDKNRFFNNIGPCVQAAEALIEVSGDMLWMGNNAPLEGAAIYLTSHAQLRLNPLSNLTFVANRGRFGSAIYANQPRPTSFLTSVLYNPLCFLTYSNISILPQDQEVSLCFINNTAIVGSAIYLQNIEHCSYTAGLEESSLPLDTAFRSDRFRYIDNENSGQAPDMRRNSSFDISTPVAEIDIYNNTLYAYADQYTSVVMHGVDELGNPTAGTFSITDRNERGLVILPAVRVLLPTDEQYRMRYNPLNMSTANDSDVLTVKDSNTRVTANLTLIQTSCPVGFDDVDGIIPGQIVCQCSVEDANILSCNTTSKDILLRDWLWGTPVTTSDGNKILFTTICSHGYCRCQLWHTDNRSECRFNVPRHLEDRDRQCACNRQGFMCGRCVSGTGVTALLNNCQACDTANVTLIVVLVIVDAAIFLGILLYSLVKPIHLAAWWYPILFYIQVLSYSTEYFPVTFDDFRSALFYMGSLLGLYFPYDFCLYPNATSVEVYALKYIPFIVALIVSTVFGVLARCCIKDPNRWSFSGVWLIAMLLINPAIHTSLSILWCPAVLKENGRQINVWHYDGTVECFTGGHLALALWACVVLVIYTLIIVVTPLAAIYRNYCGRAGKRIMSIVEVASYPYAPKYWWWFVVNYTKQLLIIFFILFEPRTNRFEVMFLALFYFLYAYTRPYKATYVNIIEIALLAYLGSILSLSQLEELQPVDNIQLDGTRLDSCGNKVPSISPEGIVFGIAYFLPVSVLLFPMGRWLFYSRVVQMLRERFCMRRGDIREGRRRQDAHPTVKWSSVHVTEATIDLTL